MKEVIYGKIYNTKVNAIAIFVRYEEEEEKTVNVIVDNNIYNKVVKIKRNQRGGIMAKFEVENNDWKLVAMEDNATEVPLKELLNQTSF